MQYSQVKKPWQKWVYYVYQEDCLMFETVKFKLQWHQLSVNDSSKMENQIPVYKINKQVYNLVIISG